MKHKDDTKKLKDGTLKMILYAKNGEELSNKLIALGLGYKTIEQILILNKLKKITKGK